MSLFTVEQLELIRRLRATNITAQQILEAFAQLESMENDSDVKMDTVASNDAVPELEATDQTTESIDQMTQSMPQLSCEPSSSAQSPVLLQHLRAQPPVAVTISASSEAVCSSPERLTVQTVPLASTAVQQQDTTPPPQLLMSKYEYNAGGRPIRSQRTPMNDIIVLDDPRELDEFMLQGEEGCIGDMKRFINQYSLRQTTVASMTGVSQPYISKLLNGNHRELSLRCRKNIYCWYLNCRRHPEKLASFLADPSTRLETNSDGELVPQRRERYVFRPILIRLLDGFFAQTPFPDLNKRIEIASACNHVLQLDKKGVGLMPKEVVSPQVVANWFANKRKEYRRRSHGADQVVHHHNGSNPGVSGDEPLPLSNGSGHHEETSSGVGSTPSPLSDGGFRSASQDAARDIAHDISLDGFQFARQPFDIVTLASRLGLTLPLPQRNDSPPLPVATLASQLFAHNLTTAHQPMVSLADQMFTNAQVSLANPLNLLQTAFPMISNENQQLNLNSLAMAYDQLRTPMIKLEQALE